MRTLLALVPILLIALPDAAFGQCVDYSRADSWLGSIPLRRLQSIADVHGAHVVAKTTWFSGEWIETTAAVVDVSDPTSPRLGCKIDNSPDTDPVRYRGDVRDELRYWVRSDFPYWFQVLDLTTCEGVSALPEIRNHGIVALSGTHAYVVGPDVEILDVDDPSTPAVVGLHSVPGLATSIRTDGDLALVTARIDERTALHVLDLRHSPNLALLHTVNGVVDVRIADFTGSRLVAYVDGQIHLAEITREAPPVSLSVLEPAGARPWPIAVDEDHLFLLSTSGAHVYRYDISDATSPAFAGRVALPENCEGEASLADELHLVGGLPYVRVVDPCAPGGSFTGRSNIFGLRFGTEPPIERIATHPIEGHAVVGNANALFVLGDVEVVALDISTDPEEPSPYATIPIAAGQGALEGTRLVLSSGSDAHVYDIAGPTPSFLGSYVGPSPVLDLAVEGDRLIVGYAEGVHVVDGAVPAAPVLLHAFDPGLPADEIEVDGATLFVASHGGDERIVAFDLSNPTSPVVIDELQLDERPLTLRLDPPWLTAVAHGGVGFLRMTKQLVLVDASDPANLSHVATIGNRAPVAATRVVGSTVYVGADDLHAVDISSPAAPASRGSIQTGGEIHDLHVANGLVYAVGRAGLTVMPTACETVTSVTSPSAPPRPLRVRVHPSPFSAGTTFEITEVASGTVRVEVFDASGRCVRVIDAGRGDSRVHWNGADARGRVLAPGIYFASVSAGSLTSTVRVVKLP